MITLIIHILTIIHFLALAGLACYGLHRLWLLRCWLREKNKTAPEAGPTQNNSFFPAVTIQLPLFNERFVAARLIDAVARLDWPHDRLQIQILDDSTDNTSRIAHERSAFWQAKGLDIEVLHRCNRQGYKAGALAAGLDKARGNFVAIFDADFIPQTDFLTRTVPWFQDDSVGMVQARWSFLNGEHSWLTRLQTLLLSPHFGIEHFVRFRRGLFFNFNGTAGIWRRKAIVESGGWQHDTVTEDLDLSYRAQLVGYRFIYLDDVSVPSELPVTLAGFRSQQQRWAKGSLQTARKILPILLKAQVSPLIKLEAMAHLLANLGWLLTTVITMTVFPALIWRDVFSLKLLLLDSLLFLGSTGAIIFYLYYYAKTRHQGRFTWSLLLLPLLSLGLAPSLAWSVVQGIFCRGGVFERTPKYGLKKKERLQKMSFFQRRNALRVMLVNLFFCSLTLLPLIYACNDKIWAAAPFLSLFPLGFLLVIFRDFQELCRAIRREEKNV